MFSQLNPLKGVLVLNTIILIEMIIYFIAMLGVGLYFGRKKMKYDDYHLGGDRLSGWILALSERSTEASAWLILGATGFAYATGFSSIWLFMGMLVGIILSWLLLAERFMEERKKYNVYTLPDYLSAKFPEHSNWIRAIGALIIIPFFTLYVGTQFGGAGGTVNQSIGIDPVIGLWIIAIIVISYSFLGGFLSVVWTDAIQAMLMVLTLVALPIFALFKINSMDLSISQSLMNAGEAYTSWTGGLTGLAAGLLIYTNLSWALGFLGGQPHISARFMALRNKKDAQIGRATGILWGVLAYSGAFLIGITALTLYGTNALDNPEMILPFMITELVPPWIAGILLSGILAAIMSTASSQLLVITTTISEDVLKKILNVKFSENKLVLISRFTVILVGAIGLIIGFTSKTLIYVVVGWAWAGVGNSFAAAILLTFFWRKTSGAGIIAALLTGSIGTVIWVSTPLEEIFTARGATLILALMAGVVFSLLFPRKEEKLSQNEGITQVK